MIFFANANLIEWSSLITWKNRIQLASIIAQLQGYRLKKCYSYNLHFGV